MLLIVKIILLIVLVLISYQDFKDKQVWAFLFPVYALCGTLLFFEASQSNIYLLNIVINLSFISIILLVSFTVAKFVFKKKFLNSSIGLGDILFFVAFAISFPSISFLNFFTFSILFALLLVGVRGLLSSSKFRSVPLAGCMSLFLIGVYLSHWMGWYDSIYYL